MTLKRHLYYITRPRILCGSNKIGTYDNTGNMVLADMYLFIRNGYGKIPGVPKLNQQDLTHLLVELDTAIEMADYLHEIYQLLAKERKFLIRRSVPAS